MQCTAAADKVPHDEPSQAHAELLRREGWVIDGFGADDRLGAVRGCRYAIYVDLPLFTHYSWVTKRFIKGLFANPKGWPENSPLWSSTLSSYRVIPLCHNLLNSTYIGSLSRTHQHQSEFTTYGRQRKCNLCSKRSRRNI